MLVLSIGLVFAADNFLNTHSQDDLNNINFHSVNLNCHIGNIFLDNNGGWVLRSNVVCDDYVKHNRTDYELRQVNFLIEYKDDDFFTCLREGILSDVICYENYVKSDWEIKLLNYEYLQRRKLISIQTEGEPILSYDLVRYYNG